MPLINVKLIEGVFSDAQKREMIAKLTDTMVAIEGEALRPVTWVMIEEVKSGHWGVGGNGLPPPTSRRFSGSGGRRPLDHQVGPGEAASTPAASVKRAVLAPINSSAQPSAHRSAGLGLNRGQSKAARTLAFLCRPTRDAAQLGQRVTRSGEISTPGSGELMRDAALHSMFHPGCHRQHAYRSARKLVPPDSADVLVKLEYFNPTGSYKDRMALALIEGAEGAQALRPGHVRGRIHRGQHRLSLAFVCAVKGHRFRASRQTRSHPRSSRPCAHLART